MFRYIAMAWDPAAGDAAAMGRACCESMAASANWRQALMRPRFSVFTTGDVSGVNEPCLLDAGRGVAVGRLFSRTEPARSRERVAELLRGTNAEVASDAGLLKDFWGRYVAFLESPEGVPHVLRDPSGTLPCFMLEFRGLTVVFSWLEDVLELLPQVPAPRVSREGLAAFLAFSDLSGRRTALEGVTQVLAGEAASMVAPSRSSSRVVWSAAAVASDPSDMDPPAAIAALRSCVTSCAEAWSSCYDPILLRLSGGVDSSILASCLAASGHAPQITCLNYHSAGARSDERTFARLAATQYGLDLIERERESAFTLERVFDVARTPVPHHYMGRVTSRSDAEVARSIGATAMFTGSGGDQLFLEVRQWWPAADHLRVRGLRGFAAAALDAARLGKVSVWGALRHAVGDLHRKMPPPLDLHTKRELLAEEVHRAASTPDDFVHPIFVAPSKLPIGKLMQAQQFAFSAGYYDPFAREQAPELVNPLISQPLIELCMKLPTFTLALGGRGRGLARKAFERDLPDAIARRRSKGGMEEHVDALLASNLGFARQALLDGELVRMGLVDRRATEQAFAAQSASQMLVGEIHFCIAVEAWLQRWSGQDRRKAR